MKKESRDVESVKQGVLNSYHLFSSISFLGENETFNSGLTRQRVRVRVRLGRIGNVAHSHKYKG